MARERRLQNHINEDLSTKLLSLKDQLREYNAKLVYMEDERQMLNARSASNAERLQSMITNAKMHYANVSSTWY
jgi:DNA recombination-dependent growth factor C